MAPESAPLPPAPSTTAFVGPAAHGPMDTAVRVHDLADHLAVFGTETDPPGPLDRAVALFFANGGTDAVVVRAAGPDPGQVVPTGGDRGLGAVPGPFSTLVLAGVTAQHRRAVAGALDRCEQEQAVLLLDLPAGTGPQEARQLTAQVRGPRSRVAVYLPWLVVDADPGGTTLVPPSAAVAGVLSRAAAQGVWGAAAAVTQEVLQGVLGVADQLSDADLELLAAEGINTVQALPEGPALRSARTLAARDGSAPAEASLLVRRLTDHVLTTLESGLGFVSGRRPEAGLGDLLRRRAEDLLDELWRGGALVGDRPEQAYFARCDATTTTPADLAAGRMVLVVGMAPARPGEFDVHRLRLDTSLAAAPLVLPAAAAVAAATRTAAERLTVVHRVDLRPLLSGDLEDTGQRLSREFSAAARTGTVLLLQEADAALARRSVAGLIEQLSRAHGVPYVLSGRGSAVQAP